MEAETGLSSTATHTFLSQMRARRIRACMPIQASIQLPLTCPPIADQSEEEEESMQAAAAAAASKPGRHRSSDISDLSEGPIASVTPPASASSAGPPISAGPPGAREGPHTPASKRRAVFESPPTSPGVYSFLPVFLNAQWAVTLSHCFRLSGAWKAFTQRCLGILSVNSSGCDVFCLSTISERYATYCKVHRGNEGCLHKGQPVMQESA